MTAPLRQPMDWLVDVVEPCSAASVTMTSPLFATLPTYWSATRYLPLEIVDENTGKHEAIRVVGTDGSTTATVVRGVEGTDPQTWDAQATIRCSPAVRDVLQVFTSYNDVNFFDQPLGARYIVAAQQVVRERTAKQGGQPPVIADPADFTADVNTPASYAEFDRLGRVKAIAVGPVTTGADGTIDVIWDVASAPRAGAAYWRMPTNSDNPLVAIASAAFHPYLTGSDSSWTGLAAVVFSSVPGSQKVQVKFFSAAGAAFANKQVRGSLVLHGK